MSAVIGGWGGYNFPGWKCKPVEKPEKKEGRNFFNALCSYNQNRKRRFVNLPDHGFACASVNCLPNCLTFKIKS